MANVGPKEEQLRALKAIRGVARRITEIPRASAPVNPATAKAAQPKQETEMAKKTKAKKTKKTQKVKTTKSEGGVRAGSKLEIIVGLLTRPEGCTTKDVLNATGWPSISMPAMAKSAGLTLSKEKDGSVTRYRGTVSA